MDMHKIIPFFAVIVALGPVNASWFWPFGDSEDEPPRLSELMSGATALIDDATELAAEGKVQDSVAKYREALAELAKIESENPDRAATTEFSSLRNKRAYVNAAIDSLLLAEARANAKSVAVTDTTDLERRFNQQSQGAAAERKAGATKPKPAAKEAAEKPSKPAVRKSAVEVLAARVQREPENRKFRLALISELLKAGRFAEARTEIDTLLKANMTDSSALNLKAVCEASNGDFKSAEATLDLVIQSHPRDYNGYYNMANLKLQGAGNKDIAKRYYETGRALGGPKDEGLEAALK